jgi:hypothetical protein
MVAQLGEAFAVKYKVLVQILTLANFIFILNNCATCCSMIQNTKPIFVLLF